MTKHKKKECHTDPMKYLMNECDEKARKIIGKTNNQQECNNIEKVRNQCVIVNNEIMDRPVREAVRIIDAIESENGCLCEKSVDNYESLDKEAKNVFPNGLSEAALKFSSGICMHGKKGVSDQRIGGRRVLY